MGASQATPWRATAGAVDEGREPTMKAIVQDRYGGLEALAYRDVPKPVPADDEVLVRVHAAGLDRGVWHVMTGLPYLIRFVVPTLGLRRPKVPVRGMDLAGRVAAVGGRVTRFQPGDAVFGWSDTGSYAEYVSATEDHFAAKPANLSYEQAAVVPISGLAALQAVRDVGEVQPGQRVLVLGAAGGVGSYAVQLAKAYGAQVTGVASTAQADLVRTLGADAFVDYTRDDVTDGSRHWDLIVDTGGHRPLSRLRRALTPRGTLVIVGSEGRGRLLGGFDRNLRAVALSRFVSQRLRMLSSTPDQDDLQTLRALLEAGTLTPHIDRSYPLGQVPEAIGHLVEGHGGGKVAITVAPRSRLVRLD
jgi:NADPH:quinone reductase-like Zn-dependent oxidoreductase